MLKNESLFFPCTTTWFPETMQIWKNKKSSTAHADKFVNAIAIIRRKG